MTSESWTWDELMPHLIRMQQQAPQPADAVLIEALLNLHNRLSVLEDAQSRPGDKKKRPG